MADKASNVVLNFKMSGQVQYAKTIREINAIMNTAAREYKNHVAAMGQDADATDKLRAEKEKLEIQMDAARKRTQMLRDQYEAMSKSTKTTTGQLAQMYSKLLDSERAEMALEKSLERVNQGLSEEAQEARKAKDELDNLKSESKLLESEQKKLTSTFKLQTAELGDNASEAEKVELAQKQLSQQMELTDRVVKNLEQQLDRAKKVYGENSREVMQLETKINQAKTEVAQFGKKLEGLKASGNQAEQGLEGVNEKLSALTMFEAAEALQGISDKLLDIGKNAMEMGLSFGDSQTYLQANLGLTADEAEKLNDVVSEVFKNGIVGSIDEASTAVMLVKQSFGDLNDADLEKLTNNITAIAKRTGTDINENVLAAQRMMQEFGITGEEATNLIAAGFQKGLNKTGDFLDTLNEYSPHFEAAGYSAEQMLQILNNGLENGAMNTDKAADAVKEFQIRLGDGSFEKIVGNYSKETQNLFKDWQNGKATVADVANSISKDLNKMSPHEQQAALSELATQFEDLGIDGAAALFSVGDAFTDVNGKADEMAQKSPGEQWESSLRELETALIPIGQTLVDTLTPVVEKVSELFDWFSSLPGPVQTFVLVFGGIVSVATVLVPMIGALALAFSGLNVALLPLIGIIAGAAAAIAGIVLVIQNWGEITDWIGEKWGQFTSWLSENVSKAKENFVNKFNEMKDGAVNKVTELKDKGIQMITSFKDNIVNKAVELKDGFVNKVNELKDGAVEKFNSLKSRVTEIWENIKSAIMKPIEDAKEAVRKAIDKIKSIMDFEWSLPKLKLPHISVKGKWDLNPFDGDGISVPKFSIEWRKKGAIFTEPTIFGMNNGKLQGAGEAGPEAVLPLNDETLGAIGEGIASRMGTQKQSLVVQLVTPNGRVLAEEIVDDITNIQNRNQFRRRRGPKYV